MSCDMAFLFLTNQNLWTHNILQDMEIYTVVVLALVPHTNTSWLKYGGSSLIATPRSHGTAERGRDPKLFHSSLPDSKSSQSLQHFGQEHCAPGTKDLMNNETGRLELSWILREKLFKRRLRQIWKCSLRYERGWVYSCSSDGIFLYKYSSKTQREEN